MNANMTAECACEYNLISENKLPLSAVVFCILSVSRAVYSTKLKAYSFLAAEL